MHTLTKTILVLSLTALSSQAIANTYKTTLEYRHQYVDGARKHSDRIKAFLDTGKNIGFELDARYNNEQKDKMFDSMSMNGSEFSAFYYNSLNKNTTGIAGLSLDFVPEGLIYVPYVRLNYKFDNNIRLQGRYKWKFWDYGMTGVDGQNYHSKIQQFDTWLGYSLQNWDFQYEFQIWQEMVDNAKPLFNKKDTNYSHNIRLMYTYKTTEGTAWKPFVEVGNVSESRITDERQTRYRVGIKYTW